MNQEITSIFYIYNRRLFIRNTIYSRRYNHIIFYI
uniref:Uncharacterized protein n=1 Tax=Escherichia coli TaxID=562 RepID=A0A890DJR5_ECOLX|nr:hypothetical protein [Escherichia coli]